jgi:hypothetical protein
MAPTYRTLYSIIAVFIIPLALAGVMSYFQYTGVLQNKGQWMDPSYSINQLLTLPPTQNTYTWYVILPCEDSCPEKNYLLSGVSTLGTKSTMASLKTISHDMMTDIGREVLEFDQIYLADPKQNLLLRYHKSNIMDLITDLKRLLKPIEKRL